jgi:hypothetical protein
MSKQGEIVRVLVQRVTVDYDDDEGAHENVMDVFQADLIRTGVDPDTGLADYQAHGMNLEPFDLVEVPLKDGPIGLAARALMEATK